MQEKKGYAFANTLIEAWAKGGTRAFSPAILEHALDVAEMLEVARARRLGEEVEVTKDDLVRWAENAQAAAALAGSPPEVAAAMMRLELRSLERDDAPPAAANAEGAAS